MPHFRTIDAAFVDLLERLLSDGHRVERRNGYTLELVAETIVIDRPIERFLHIEGRNNNPFAAIAETMWVLAGRNDLAYLTPYLKRAPDYSDDGGLTWRAGYGPRLRSWHGVDQVAQAYELLRASPMTRRAVISLFDPQSDYQNSVDIPCNNWLHFLVRDGHLDVHVVARSTDVWFGLSAINVFEWSVMLEMMARWLHIEVGRLIFFTSSLHLYSEHEGRARALLENRRGGRGESLDGTSRYDTDWVNSVTVNAQWLDLEAHLRAGADLKDLTVPFRDPMLVTYLRAIDIFWAFKRGASREELAERFAVLEDRNVHRAAWEFVNRPQAQEH